MLRNLWTEGMAVEDGPRRACLQRWPWFFVATRHSRESYTHGMTVWSSSGVRAAGHSNAPCPLPRHVCLPRVDNRTRYTLDLTREQHRFLKRFALEIDVEASKVMRVLPQLFQTDRDLSSRVTRELTK